MSLAPDAPFGTWSSPITAEVLLQGTVGLAHPRVHEGELFWLESRPAEGGRVAVVRRRRDGTVADCLPPPWNARSRVHEYGGIGYTVLDGTLYFTHFADQRIHALPLDAPDAAPRPVTPDDGTRWADLAPDPARRRLVAVGEADRDGDEPRNFLAAIPVDGDGTVEKLVGGHDFFSAPRLSPDGTRLAWLAWNHPRMPWDGTLLCESVLDGAGRPSAPRTVAGGPDEAIFQPEWDARGRLLCVSDRSGWWNLHRVEAAELRALHPMEADFGLPLWVFGMRTYVPLPDGRIACSWHAPEGDRLGLLDPEDGRLEPVDLPFTALDGIAAGDGEVVLVAASPTRFPELVSVPLGGGAPRVLRRASTLELDPAVLAAPEPVTFPTSHGGRAHGYFYRPAHPHCRGAEGERPPLLVIGHGGPTGATSTALNLKIRFWTSRGFAVLDVDYRGSTGYGRAYRDALKGGWGELDVDDCVAAARFVAGRGDVDPARMAIRGSSAGGLTVLGALAFHDVFRAGASLYGVADLEALARDTHKFESRYLDSLVGPLPEAADRYRARSPLHHADGIDAPVIFLQGLEDRIVPPSQAEAMVEALDARGVPVAYVPFEGEQHGFRRAETIRAALEAELWFYGRVFGFVPAGFEDRAPPIELRNLA